MALISPATKRKIERKTGLVLSDAVNVAMFLLTLFSLIIAIVSVAVAVWTYVAAERGGKEQLKALEKQTDTLNTAADLLKEQTNRLSAADKALTGLLTRAEEDAKHRSELENRRPIITGKIGCGELDIPLIKAMCPFSRI